MRKTSKGNQSVSCNANPCCQPAYKTALLKYGLAASISLLTFIIYLPSLQNEFVNWDDNLYVYDNPFIRSLNAAFFKLAFFDFYAANWHPLTWMSHAIDYAVWGLNPMGHHLTSNIFHAINTFLVVLLVVKLMEIVNAVIPACPESIRRRGEAMPRSKRRRSAESPLQKKDSLHPEPVPTWSGVAGMTNQFSLSMDTKSIFIAAATTGLLFGLHPLHVESVAWVSERKDLLCALFFLLSIMMYLKYQSPSPQSPPIKGGEVIYPLPWRGRAREKGAWYLLSLLFFTLALMSKPMAVSLPVVLFILDWYPLKRLQSLKSFLSVFIEKLPFIFLSSSSALLAIMAQKSGGAVVSLEYAPLSVRTFVAIKSFTAYLLKMVLPLNLLPFYPYPRVVEILSLEYLLPVILVTGITIAGAVIAAKHKLWLSVWGYYVITLLPVIGLVRVGSQELADRYIYLPCIGPFLLIGLGAAWIRGKAGALNKRIAIVRIIAAVIAISAFVCMSYLSLKQIGVWKNSETLWTSVIEKEPGVPTAYKNRASYFFNSNQFDKAIADYDMLLSIDPSNYEAYILRTVSVEAFFERGSFYLRQGNNELAASDFQKACEHGSAKGCAALKSLGTVKALPK